MFSAVVRSFVFRHQLRCGGRLYRPLLHRLFLSCRQSAAYSSAKSGTFSSHPPQFFLFCY